MIELTSILGLSLVSLLVFIPKMIKLLINILYIILIPLFVFLMYKVFEILTTIYLVS